MIGARCTLTPDGKTIFSFDQERVGDIVGQSRDGTCWRVHWDGRGAKSVDNLHKDFVYIHED